MSNMFGHPNYVRTAGILGVSPTNLRKADAIILETKKAGQGNARAFEEWEVRLFSNVFSLRHLRFSFSEIKKLYQLENEVKDFVAKNFSQNHSDKEGFMALYLSTNADLPAEGLSVNISEFERKKDTPVGKKMQAYVKQVDLANAEIKRRMGVLRERMDRDNNMFQRHEKFMKAVG